jgi:hypothetical protein
MDLQMSGYFQQVAQDFENIRKIHFDEALAGQWPPPVGGSPVSQNIRLFPEQLTSKQPRITNSGAKSTFSTGQ